MEKTCSIDVKREYVSKMEALLDAVDSLTQGRRLIFWGGGNTAKIYWDDMKKNRFNALLLDRQWCKK